MHKYYNSLIKFDTLERNRTRLPVSWRAGLSAGLAGIVDLRGPVLRSSDERLRDAVPVLNELTETEVYQLDGIPRASPWHRP